MKKKTKTIFLGIFGILFGFSIISWGIVNLTPACGPERITSHAINNSGIILNNETLYLDYSSWDNNLMQIWLCNGSINTERYFIRSNPSYYNCETGIMKRAEEYDNIFSNTILKINRGDLIITERDNVFCFNKKINWLKFLARWVD